MVEKLKVFNIDKVKEAFEQSGIVPEQGSSLHDCVAAFLYPEEVNLMSLEILGYSVEYIAGVIEGWDDSQWNTGIFKRIDRNNLKYALGNAHGVSCRKIILGS